MDSRTLYLILFLFEIRIVTGIVDYIGGDRVSTLYNRVLSEVLDGTTGYNQEKPQKVKLKQIITMRETKMTDIE